VLTEFAVRAWQFTLVVFLAVVALGGYALVSIPKAADPTFPVANFVIIGVLPGSEPRDLERLVADPIEAKLKALDDVKSMRTQIDAGLAVVRVDFRSGVDPDRKRDEVLREVSALRASLPPELTHLDVRQYNAAHVNILQLALVSDSAPYYVLEKHARALRRRLENLSGIGSAEINGLPKREVSVVLDVPRMVALGISAREVINAIGADSQNVPAGAIEAGARRFNVKTGGDYTSVEEIRTTVLRGVQGGVVRVADVADVRIGDAEASQITRFDGHRAVLVVAAQKERQNIFTVMRSVDAELRAFESTLPHDVRLVRGFEQVHNVEHRLNDFTRDFGVAILLVLITLLPLGTRASLVVMVSIPLSLALGLLLLQLTGFTINQLSIVGFVIALGLLVDDSVVVIENITRHLREGLSPREAAIRATRQISGSVIGCTATLLFAFLPLLMLPGVPGQFIRPLPVAIVYTIAASLLVSLTVVPFLASVLLVPEGQHGNVFLRGLNRLIEGSYRLALKHAVAHPAVTIVTAVLLFVGSLALVPRIGFSLFPKAGTPLFMVQLEAEEGASLAQTDRATRFVEGVLQRHPELQHIAASVGKGNPQMFYNVGSKNERPNIADVLAEARTESPAARSALFAKLRRELGAFAGAHIELIEFEMVPSKRRPWRCACLATTVRRCVSPQTRSSTSC